MGKKKVKAAQDVVLLHSPTADGKGIRAIRSRADTLELAELRPLKEGKPITGGEVVRLRPRAEHPLLCDVEVQFSTRTEDGHAGPAQVATDSYRQNWSTIFGELATRSDTGQERGEEELDSAPPERKPGSKLIN